jgi:hypothetical protein
VNRIDETRRTDEARDFDAFFDQEYTPLLRLLFAMTGNLTEAEELAQEAMTRAFERWGRISGMDSPAGYVYRMAVGSLGTTTGPGDRGVRTRLVGFPRQALCGGPWRGQICTKKMMAATSPMPKPSTTA